MRVLIAARHLTGPGGVQSWVDTVSTVLARDKHEVEHADGPAIRRGDLLEYGPGRYDLGIFAHGVTDTSDAFALCGKVLHVSHGIIEYETPAPGANVYAYTSEEVREHWVRDLRTPEELNRTPIIRQPIDLDFWRPSDTDWSHRPYMVRFGYYGGMGWLHDLADDMGWGFMHVNNHTHAEARQVIQGADCVLASGRAYLEAMACGVPVVLCDERPYHDGPLLDTRPPDEQMRFNYSGRGGVAAERHNTAQAITDAVEKGSNRAHVEQHHDAREIVRQILELI